jgi:hypothetical protein
MCISVTYSQEKLWQEQGRGASEDPWINGAANRVKYLSKEESKEDRELFSSLFLLWRLRGEW